MHLLWKNPHAPKNNRRLQGDRTDVRARARVAGESPLVIGRAFRDRQQELRVLEVDHSTACNADANEVIRSHGRGICEDYSRTVQSGGRRDPDEVLSGSPTRIERESAADGGDTDKFVSWSHMKTLQSSAPIQKLRTAKTAAPKTAITGSAIRNLRRMR